MYSVTQTGWLSLNAYLQKCEELLVADKPAIANLSKQGNVFLGGDDEAAFCVPRRI